MINFIYNIPNLLLFALIGFLFIGISILNVYLVGKYISPQFRYRENPVLISVTTLIGVIYAVLVGFTILYELNNYSQAQQAEKEEGKSLITIYRLARTLPENITLKIRQDVQEYANLVINHEWPLMESGKKVDGAGLALIDDLFKGIHQAFPTSTLAQNQIMIFNNMAVATNDLYNDHQERVNRNHSALSPNVWFVIILATLITLGINFLYGIDFRLHIASMVAISLVIASVFYLIITLDRPYRGDFPIKPTTFQEALDYIQMHDAIDGRQS